MNILQRYQPVYEGEGKGGGAGGGEGGGAGGGGAGGGGAQHTGPWYADPAAKLPEPVQKWADGHKFSDIGAALNYGMTSEKLARDRNVIERWDPAKPLDWKGWSELGWNEDATKYQPKPPQLKDGEPFSKPLFDAFVKAAHAHKLPAAQAEGVYGAMFTATKELMANMTAEDNKRTGEEAKALSDALDKEWGAHKPEKTALAERAFRALKIKPIEGKGIEDILGAPGMLRVMAALGEAMGEDRLTDVLHGAGSSRHASTIEAELNKLETDPQFMAIMKDERHPRHEEIVNQRRKLIADLTSAQQRRAA